MNKKIKGAKKIAHTISIFAIAASLAMAQQPAGTIRAWGDNAHQELGAGLTGDSVLPLSVTGLSDVVTVAAGQAFSFAIKSDGSLWSWGFNNFGSLGIGSAVQENKPLPVPVTGLGSGVIAVSAGDFHGVAVKSDGSVWAWGTNVGGELGQPVATLESNVPVQVPGLGPGSGVIAVASGLHHNLALKSDGSVVAWGRNDSGELGVGPGGAAIRPVVAVSGLGSGSGVIAIAAGQSHSLALKSDGTVAAWGENLSGQLGFGGDQSNSVFPILVAGFGSGSGVVAIAAGAFHSLALKSDGSVFAWGRNDKGQLGEGDGAPLQQLAPTPVNGLGSGSGVIALSGGLFFSATLKSDGSEWTWGDNVQDELGDGTNVSKTTPVQVSNLNGGATFAQGPQREHNLTVVQPVAALSATSLAFGDQLVGSLSTPQMITIQNKGQDPLTINGFSVSGAASADFKVSATPTPFTVSPGSSTAVSVAFDPTAGFARLATLLIDDDAFQAPQFITLSGNGLAQADIAVGLGASSAPAHNKKDLTYTISVKNGGPTSAPAVVMNDPLPAGTFFASAKTSQGTCLTPGPGTIGAVTCNLGTLNSGAAATITLVVTVNASDRPNLVNTVSATAAAPDPNLSNNSATVVTSVIGSKH